jgi:hypothetical protein
MVSTQELQQKTFSTFAPFSQLPIEIRNQIWKISLAPRVVKWKRTEDQNSFEVPSRTLSLLSVNRESREAAFFYGEYQEVSADPRTMYFSPIIDYLLFDPGWVDLVGNSTTSRPDPIDSLLPELSNIRNIMVHPNYTEKRKKPTTLFEKLRSLQRILVAADEKMIGAQRKHMLATVYDIDKYYVAMARGRVPDIVRPYIAVGCLGWVGPERHSMHHGSEDHRQLVAVFDNEAQMADHAVLLREEEWKFVQERFKHGRPKLVLNFRQHRGNAACQQSCPELGAARPPSYSEPTTSHASNSRDAEASTEDGHPNARNKRQRVNGEFQGFQAANPRNDEELPEYAQIA